jgi:ubiquinone/menaquinone biosynthesis C-methylase UbiE
VKQEGSSAGLASHANHRRDIGHFDRWAASYDRSWTQWIFFGPVHQGVVRAAVTVAAAPTRILDVGCGTGALLRVLCERFPEADLTGVDASTEMIRMAAASNPAPERLRFVQGTAEELPFPGSQFDLVVSTISFHHWADQSRGLREAARVLAPGAPFVLADHFATPLQRIFFLTPERRQRFHTPREVESMLASAGLGEHRWHDIHRIGPLPLVAGVTACKLLAGPAHT